MQTIKSRQGGRPRVSSGRRNRPYSSSSSGNNFRKKINRGNKRRSFSSGRNQNNGRGKKVLPTFNPSQFINKNPIDVAPEVYVPTHTFNDFGSP